MNVTDEVFIDERHLRHRMEADIPENWFHFAIVIYLITERQ